MIEQKYISLQAIIHRKLNNIGIIALTTDIATVMNSTRSFIVLTAHYIDDENATFESFCLGVKNLIPHHTAENICSDLTEMIDAWGIKKDNIISVTTDNGANIVAAVNLLLGNKGHVSCFAHNINLVVTKALGAVQDVVAIIEKVKRIVAYFKHSNTAQDDLRGEQRREGKKDGTFLYLKQEVPTRWNSTYYCLERFILLSGHIGKILLMTTHKKAPPMLTATELSIIEECLQLLAPFESATKTISGEKYLSGSLVIPLINCLNLSLQRIIVSHDLSQKLKEELSQQIERRLRPQEKNILLGVATMLDPRFKKIHFNSPLMVSNIINRLKTEVRENARRTEIEDRDTEPDNVGTATTSKDIWGIHEEAAASLWSASDIDNPGMIPSELKLYLEQPTIPRNSDPLRFWASNKNAYPGTAKVALKYLTTLGASVSSERVVSWLNYVCNDLRSRLTPEHTNQLVFLGALDNKYWQI
ncbi:zinc finger BED domain-containing protein 1-like isoform X2 [Sitophilus oryzae]|nr:zinc finger BED domain-containing protein 1-like isoform X2 [Sitophilus oryzae]